MVHRLPTVTEMSQSIYEFILLYGESFFNSYRVMRVVIFSHAPPNDDNHALNGKPETSSYADYHMPNRKEQIIIFYLETEHTRRGNHMITEFTTISAVFANVSRHLKMWNISSKIVSATRH